MGRMLRPKRQVLPDSALVQAGAHYKVAGDQPYYVEEPVKEAEPAGVLQAGSIVRLVAKAGGGMWLVEDGEERRVYTASTGLRTVK